MATTAINIWNTGTLRAKEGETKIADPGIFSNLSLTGIEKDDKKVKYIFSLKDSNNYTDIAVFPEANPSYTKSVQDQQKAVIEKMISIADAVGSPTEVSKLPSASDYMMLFNMLHKYIESKKGARVNIKTVLDAEENFANVAMFGFIEKHTDGQEPKLFFSQWEKDNNRAKRTKPRPKAEPKSDTENTPSFAKDTEDFMAILNEKPLTEDGLKLPF